MNKSKIYLFPLLINTLSTNKEFISQVQNTYLFHQDHSKEICMGLTFKNSILKNPKFIEDIRILILNEGFIQIEESENEILYLFEFPEKHFKEYFKFMKGKYSQFSRRSKEIILKFWTESQIKDKSSILDLIHIKQVLFKDHKLRCLLEEQLNVKLPFNAELETIVNIEDEMFTNNKMKESV